MEDGNAEAAARVEEALKSFACYLYVGKSHPIYKSKPWNDDDHYLQGERMRNLEILAADKKTELVPIDKIKLAMDSQLIRRPETLMFALAMCARQKKSEKLRAAAYYFLAEHCKEWKYFILFIKYASYLCKVEGTKDKVEEKGDDKKPIGWGHGWKNAVNKWYFTKSPPDLATLVVRHKGDHGWTHKDIFKLSHPETSSLEVEKQAILCYVMKGLEAAEKEFDADPEAKKILEHIRLTEKFKRCRNKHEVIKLLAIHKFPIDYVHPTLKKDKDVWLALLNEMDIRSILNNLPKLNQWGLLTKLGPATPTVVRSLTDTMNISWNKVLPAEILLVLNRYESPPTLNFPFRYHIRLELKPEDTEKKVKTPSVRKGKRSTVVVNSRLKDKSRSLRLDKRFVETKDPDIRIRDALRTALTLSQTVDITNDCKRRYLVSIRIPPRYRKSICAESGLALALPLFHRIDWTDCPVPDGPVPDDPVTIIGYEPRCNEETNIGGGIPLPITKDTTFDEAIGLLQGLRADGNSVLTMQLGALGWAYAEKKPFDVFINVTNEPPIKEDLQLMKLYREKMELPNAKFVNVVIHKVPWKLEEEVWKDSLIINGFDVHVPWIIEAYARGLF